MISCDIQLLIGLILYYNSTWVEQLKLGGTFGQIMKNPTERFFAMEHAIMMLLAWIFVHIGRSSLKTTTSNTIKHKRSLIYFGIALLIILLMIPWPFRQLGIGRALFPKF